MQDNIQECQLYLASNHKEADKKLILNVVDAITDDATEVQIHLLDTVVFVLPLLEV